MHSSGSMTSMLGPSWKQSTGQTSTQSMYLHLMQFSVTTKVMRTPRTSSARILARMAPGEGYQVMRLDPRRAIGEEALQRKTRRGEGDVFPGDVGRIHQLCFQ